MSAASDAHAALREAIWNVIALEPGAHELLLTDWVVAYTCVRAADDGSQVYGACYPDGTLAAYRALGLIRILEHQLVTNGWEEEAG